MTITVKFFAVLRERAGISQLALDLPAGATIATARASLLGRFPMFADLLPRVAFAVNRSYAPIETDLHEGDELALIPPVSGG